MPASGARTGTRPKRYTRGGDGRVGTHTLTCGHASHDDEPAVSTRAARDRLYLCPHGCGLVKRADIRRTTDRKEERRDSFGDRDALQDRGLRKARG
jgi:hypothetical protein